MPRRNLIVLFAAAIVSLACYMAATRNRYVLPLTRAMNIVTSEYIDEVEPQVLFEGAMDGMLEKLDAYSGYVSPDDFQQFQQAMDGEFEGVGIVIEADDEGRLSVVDALVGKPAYIAGIRAGDKILSIEGQELQDVPLREAVNMIRGRPGTRVRMLVQHARGGEPREYALERAKIPLESVLGDARRKDGTWVYRFVDHPRIGFIRIVNFGERTTDELRRAFDSYERSGEEIDGLVIDLRGNAGGLLKSAVETCNLFLERGLIVSTKGRGGVVREQHKASAGTQFPADVPIVILIDKLSASASEIVAACLQDHERATIAGQRSWGKGTVQNVILLPVDGQQSALRLTVGSYHRPSGVEIHKRKDAKEEDPWGVRPLAELEVHPTNQQYDAFMLARRKRDLLTWEDLIAAREMAAREKRIAEDTSNESPDSATIAPQPPAEGPSTEEPSIQPPAVLDDGSEPEAGSSHGSGAAPTVPLPPTPVPEPEDAPPQPTADQAAAANALIDPATIDPQLQKALEFLQQKIARQGRRAGRA